MSLTSIFNRPQVLNLIDTPTFQRHAFGSLIVTNAILRPTATLSDKSATSQERHYSAMRELFHQIICFGCHYTLAPLFEKFAFKLAKRFPKLEAEFGNYKTFQQINEARQSNVTARRTNRLILAGLRKEALQHYEEIPKVLTGVLRVGDSLGTIAALACFAPLVNNYLLGPLLKLLKPSPKEAPPTLPHQSANHARLNTPYYSQLNPMNTHTLQASSHYALTSPFSWERQGIER